MQPNVIKLKNEHKKTIKFAQEYKWAMFQDWYNQGRPSVFKFYPYVVPDENGNKPTEVTVRNWIQEDFRERADLLDKQVTDEMNKRLIEVKIEMLNRHAQIAVELENKALESLRQLEKLSEAGSIRLLELGIKVEQGSRGIPEMLDKMRKLSDDDLLKQIQELATTSSHLTLEANVDSEE